MNCQFLCSFLVFLFVTQGVLCVLVSFGWYMVSHRFNEGNKQNLPVIFYISFVFFPIKIFGECKVCMLHLIALVCNSIFCTYVPFSSAFYCLGFELSNHMLQPLNLFGVCLFEILFCKFVNIRYRIFSSQIGKSPSCSIDFRLLMGKAIFRLCVL